MTKRNEMLKMLIVGNLDLRTTAGEVNRQIKQLKLDAINLKIAINVNEINKVITSLKKDMIFYYEELGHIVHRQEKERERAHISEYRARTTFEKNLKLDREKSLKEEQGIRKLIEEQRVKEEQRVSKERERAIQEEEKLRGKNERKQSTQEKSQLQNQSLTSIYQEKAKNNADRLLPKLGNSADKRALQEWLSEVEKLTNKTPNLRQEISRLNERFKQISTNAGDAGRRATDLGQEMEYAFNKATLWNAANSIFLSINAALKSLVSTIIEVDTKIIELSKVMSYETGYSELMSKSIDLTREYGRSLTEAQDSLLEFGKTGYDTKDAFLLTNATLLGANVTGLSTAKTIEFLTGVLNKFNLSAEESRTVIDKLAAVDDKFDVTALGLAQSLTKAGANARAFGVTIDELLGMTTSIHEITRDSGEVIGSVAA